MRMLQRMIFLGLKRRHKHYFKNLKFIFKSNYSRIHKTVHLLAAPHIIKL